MYHGDVEYKIEDLEENVDTINQALHEASDIFQELDEAFEVAQRLPQENKMVILAVTRRLESQIKRINLRLDKIEKRLPI